MYEYPDEIFNIIKSFMIVKYKITPHNKIMNEIHNLSDVYSQQTFFARWWFHFCRDENKTELRDTRWFNKYVHTRQLHPYMYVNHTSYLTDLYDQNI